MSATQERVGPFQAGEKALLIDRRARRYLITLVPGGQFHSHLGPIEHDDIIGTAAGSYARTTGGSKLLALRPTLADYVLKMRRGAQVIYPKDIGLIIMYADIHPGATVIEAGSGSGALTLALARSVGATGRVISYDVREDHLNQARANIEAWYEGLGAKPDNIELRLADVFEDRIGVVADRIVLDVPEPWHGIGTTTDALAPGGILCCYLPTVPQVVTTVDAMRAGFNPIETFEGLVRTWNIEGTSVRPDHRMVAHTGFIITGRKLATLEDPVR